MKQLALVIGILGIAYLLSAQSLGPATKNEWQSVTAGAGTTFTLASISFCAIVTNDDPANAVDIILNGQAAGTAIRVKALETLKVGCGDNPPFATSSIRYTAVAGSPALRIITYELP